jgi:hypothetical protein
MPPSETQPKRGRGRPPGQKYKDWAIVIRQNPTEKTDIDQFWEALEALASLAPSPPMPEIIEEPEEELAIWAS